MPWGGPSSGLINRWPLDTANRSGATDADVVSADTGTEGGTVALAIGPTGAANSALSFDGTSGRVSLASSPFDWVAGSFSVGFWAYINNNAIVSPGGSGASNQVYFNDDRNGLGNDYVIFANVAANAGQVRVSCCQTGLFSPAGSVPSATWTHVLFTNSGGGGTGTLALYINGVAV